MGILDRLFGSSSTKTRATGKPEATFSEGDNRGTRHDTMSKATAYWMGRMQAPKKDPFVMYVFDRESDAREALLELPCVHTAQDSGNLICTDVLIFGCYERGDGKVEALVCGDDLSHDLWQLAGAAFTRHGGTKKSDLEPEKRADPKPRAAGSKANVKFVREERNPAPLGGTATYRIHKAPDAASAKLFLDQAPVTQQMYYVIVETPEGNYCRDIDGMYKE